MGSNKQGCREKFWFGLLMLIGGPVILLLIYGTSLSEATQYNKGALSILTSLGAMGIIVWVILFWLVGLFSNALPIFDNQRSRILIITVLALASLFGFYQMAPKSGVSPRIVDTLSPVCSGIGIKGTAHYTEGDAKHPTIIIEMDNGKVRQSSAFDYDDSLPNAVQAVVCFKYDYVNKGYCNYRITHTGNGETSSGSKSIDMSRVDISANLVAAESGQIITTFTLEGSDPGDCPDPDQGETVPDGEIITGTKPSIDDIKQWLSKTYGQPSP